MTIPALGPAEQSQSDHADCGTLAGNAWLSAFTRSAVSLPTLDNSTATRVSDAINLLAIPGIHASAEYPPNILDYLRMYQGDGIIAAVQVNSDTSLNPNGPVAHWLDPFTTNVDSYNCWTGGYQRDDPTLFQEAYTASGIGVVRITYIPNGVSMNVQSVLWPQAGVNRVDDFWISSGTVWHSWPGAANGEPLYGENGELRASTIVSFDFKVVDGVMRGLFLDNIGNLFLCYQGVGENVWHVQGVAR